MQFAIIDRSIEPGEYQNLRAQTSWNQLPDEMVGRALKASLFSVVVEMDEKVIAMGRVVGDGALYFYIQDIIVDREFRGMGISRLIMERIEQYLSKVALPHAFIGLMAAEGVSGIYEKYGYRRRGENAPGMFRVISG